MRKVFALLAVLSTVPAIAGTVHPTYTFTDFSLTAAAVKRVTQLPLTSFADYNGAILTASPVSQVTSGVGAVTFSNTVAGYSYRVTLDTAYGSTVRTCGYPSTVSGPVNGRDYLGEIKGMTFYYLYGMASNLVGTIPLANLPAGVVTNNYSIPATFSNNVTIDDTHTLTARGNLVVSNTATFGGGGIGFAQIADGDVFADRFIAADTGGAGPGFVGDLSGGTNGNASVLAASGIFPTARLGSGSATASTFLSGASTWVSGVQSNGAVNGVTNQFGNAAFSNATAFITPQQSFVQTNGGVGGVTNPIGTAAWSNAAAFYPSNNPAGFAPSNALGSAAFSATSAFDAANAAANGTNNPSLVRTNSNLNPGKAIMISSLSGVYQDCTNLTPPTAAALSSAVVGMHDDSLVVQAALDKSTNGKPLMIIQDGRSMIARAMIMHSNTTLLCLPNCGFILSNYVDRPMLVNDLNTNYSSWNLRVEGGIWNGNGTNQHYHPDHTSGGVASHGDGLYVETFWFAGVSNLVIKDVTLKQPMVYGALINNCRAVVCDGVTVDYYIAGSGYGGDGLHFLADNRDIMIRNYWGNASDDNIAFDSNSTSSAYWATNVWTRVGCVQSNILLSGITIQRGPNASRDQGIMCQPDAANGFHVKNVTIRDYYGEQVEQGLIRGGLDSGDYLIIENVHFLNASSAGLTIQGVTNVWINGVTIPGASPVSWQFGDIGADGADCQSVSIRNVEIGYFAGIFPGFTNYLDNVTIEQGDLIAADIDPDFLYANNITLNNGALNPGSQANCYFGNTMVNGVHSVGSGDGSQITGLNASSLASGTVGPAVVNFATGGFRWNTNSTLPAVSASVIKAWLSVTNDSGKIGKIPVYY